MTYFVILVLLLALEMGYFKVADHFNIIDKPNERSSHSTIVLRGGGVIFTLAVLVWAAMMGIHGEATVLKEYLPFICGLVMIAGVSFIDDIHSLPDSVRLVAQFSAMVLMLYPSIIDVPYPWAVKAACLILALIVCVGATNVINFMDGINGITAGYSLVVLVPLLLLTQSIGYIEDSFLYVAIIGVQVFCIFNFRPKGKAKCFAGDVGSIGIAFIMLFALGRLIFRTGDVTYLILLLVYGVDGCLTIIHRIMLHENLGKAHRKHAYQIMANELKIGHVKVSLLYMAMQLAVSLGFVFLCPDSMVAHWAYFVCAAAVLCGAYVAFMKKYYHLHEEYLLSINHGSTIVK